MIILHRAAREYVYPIARDRLVLRLQASCRALRRCAVVFWNRSHPEQKNRQMMDCAGRDGTLDYFVTELVFTHPAKYIQYYFELQTEEDTVFYSREGRSEGAPRTFFEFLDTAEHDVYSVPDWARGAVLYHIFPERFYNGDAINDPADCVSWDAQPTRENFFGGDLAGIHEKLPYLKSLGVQVICFTPIFASPSNHKYDTEDYYRIDPEFGTEQDFIDLVETCHQLDIRVVLDGVFNHCGYEFAPFQDVLKHGEKSYYANWFYIDSLPICVEPPNYECVGFYKWMPKLRYSNPQVRDYFIGVGLHWIRKANIDGWRLDVADEVDFTFWQEFRRAIKAEKPDALLLAETWKDGGDLLRGDQMDSVMNYLFRDACVDFFAQSLIDAPAFDSRIQRTLHRTPLPIQDVMYNLLGSHDTPRFATLCGEDGRRLRLAAVFQMTFPGMPVIYYGDETGLLGENDPDCRRAMNWDSADEELRTFFRSLIELRRNSQALRYGDFRTVFCEGTAYGFVRRGEHESVYIAINNGAQSQHITLPILERAEDIKSMECPFSGINYALRPYEHGHNAYNADINTYLTRFETVLPAYCFEIIIIRRK